MRWAVRRVGQPPGLRHGVPGGEDVLELLPRQWVRRGDPPDFGVTGRRSTVTLRDVHGVQGRQTVDDGVLGLFGEDFRHREVRGELRAPQVRHVEHAVDQSGHCLVVASRIVRRERRGEA